MENLNLVIDPFRLLPAPNFHVLTECSGVDGFPNQGGSSKDTAALFGWIGYAVTWLLALVIAFDTLGLRQVADVLVVVLLFVLRLLVTMVLIVLGCCFARFVGEAAAQRSACVRREQRRRIRQLGATWHRDFLWCCCRSTIGVLGATRFSRRS